MSYILEALKKAQAERQLGSAPDIHAPAPTHVPAAATRTSRTPLLIGLSAGIAIAAVAGVLVWRAQAPATASAPAAVLAGNGPAQGRAAAPVPPPAPPTEAVMPVPAPASQAGTAAPVPAPAREAVAPAPTQALANEAGTPARTPGTAAPAAAPAAAPTPSARKPAQPEPAAAPAPRVAAAPAPASPEAVYLPAPAPARAPDPAPVARAPEPVDDNLRTLQQLPEALQREVPRVSVGGYIYSPNPSDRLLLVDKTLRREGEELAPGLVLERLMPKYAVMNYRGTRYRVAY